MTNRRWYLTLLPEVPSTATAVLLHHYPIEIQTLQVIGCLWLRDVQFVDTLVGKVIKLSISLMQVMVQLSDLRKTIMTVFDGGGLDRSRSIEVTQARKMKKTKMKQVDT